MKDLTGQRFGRLVVLAQAEDTFQGRQRKRNWMVRCDCGTEKVAGATVLTTGRTRSCGCLLRETNTLKRMAAPRYQSFHTRLRRDRGSAAEQRCVDCDQRAEEWSYDHQDPEELAQDGVRYSVKPEHYQPRCRSCHRRLDSIEAP